MDIFRFVLFCLATIGMTNIVVDSVLFAPIRDWVKAKLPGRISHMLGCYQCMGFWCSLFLGALIISYDPVIVFACGCAGSFVCELAALFMNFVEARSVIEIKSE